VGRGCGYSVALTGSDGGLLNELGVKWLVRIVVRQSGGGVSHSRKWGRTIGLCVRVGGGWGQRRHKVNAFQPAGDCAYLLAGC
jgi:hypothetical protein